MTAPARMRDAARQALPLEKLINHSGEVVRLFPAVLTTADLPHIVSLHEEVFSASPPGTVRHDDAQFFSGVLDGKGVILGFLSESGELAAYGVLTFPEPDEMHYGRSLGLPEAQWPLLAQLEGASVGSAWLGLGLHKRLGRWRIETASILGFRHISATVSPANSYSLKNLLALGLSIKGLHWLYGGLQRYVLHRDLLEKSVDEADREVDAADLELQETLFAQSARAYGWRGEQRPETLLFAIPKET